MILFDRWYHTGATVVDIGISTFESQRLTMGRHAYI